MITDEEAKAVQEGAKVARSLTAVATDFGHFVGRITGRPLEQASGIVEDKLRYMRWERRIRLMKRSEEFLKEVGVSAVRPLPLNVAVPLLEAASLEEIDEMQDLWAKLLVNAIDSSSPHQVSRSLVSILSDMGPKEAYLLDRVVNVPAEFKGAGDSEDMVLTATFPDEYKYRSDEKLVNPPTDIEIALWNLARLGCIAPAMTFGGLTVAAVHPTALGKALVEACTLRAKS